MLFNTTGKRSFNRFRLTSLSLAFLLIVINPLLNYYASFDFIQGWYQSFGVGNLWFVSPLEGLESLLTTRQLFLPSLVGMTVPLALAFFCGRIFCSWVCPIAFMGELLDRLRRRISRKKYIHDRLVLAKKILWFTLCGELLLSMILGAPLFVFLSPPGLVGRELMMAVFFHKLALEGVVIVIVLLLELVTRRFFCRYFCPLGGLLAFTGARRRLLVMQDSHSCNNCKKCDKICPMGLQPSVGEAETAYCWNCGSCVDSCDQDALAFGWQGREK